MLGLRDDESLTENFELQTSDSLDATSPSRLIITIQGMNDAPVAIDDAASTFANALLIGNQSGVTRNDSDPDQADSFTVTAVNGEARQVGVQFQLPSGALLRVKADGDYLYDPNGMFDTLPIGSSANDSFEYTIRDIQGVNEVPSGVVLSNNSVLDTVGVDAVVGSLRAIDPDDGDSHSFQVIGASPFGVSASTLIVSDPSGLVFDTDYLVQVQATDANGLSVDQVFFVRVELAPDETSPTSSIATLPPQAIDLLIPIVVSGNDAGPATSETSGAREYRLYVSEGGAFEWFATVPADAPKTEFMATSDRNYFFRSLAVDHAGNVETKTGFDAQAIVGDFDSPGTMVVSDTGSGALVFFDVYVSVDGGVAQLIGTTGAGIANAAGEHGGSVLYQGRTDGIQHSYRFFSIGRDSASNIEAAPQRSGDIIVTETFANDGFAATGIDVGLGGSQRSYIRNVDVLFNSDQGLDDLLASGRVAVERFGLDAVDVQPETGEAITNFVLNKSGDHLRLDFGGDGITDNTRSNLGDGFYRILVDVNGDGDYSDSFDGLFEFRRILGDANGDAVVDQADLDLISVQNGTSGNNLDGDVDGDGNVSIIDRLITISQFGVSLSDELKNLLDD